MPEGEYCKSEDVKVSCPGPIGCTLAIVPFDEGVNDPVSVATAETPNPPADPPVGSNDDVASRLERTLNAFVENPTAVFPIGPDGFRISDMEDIDADEPPVFVLENPPPLLPPVGVPTVAALPPLEPEPVLPEPAEPPNVGCCDCGSVLFC